MVMGGIRVALVALLVGIGAQGQELHRVPQPKVADSAWAYVLRCTQGLGVTPVKGGELKDVKWFSTELPHTQIELLIGMWRAPDSVIIDNRFIERKTWVAHELLHHLLRGPPDDEDQTGHHPYVPFTYPCKLMPWQNGVFDNRTGILVLPDGTTVVPRKPLTNPLD